MNLPIGSISAPPGVTHGSQLSRLLARRGSDTSNTRVSSVQHFEAHFALCNTSNTGVCSVQHFVKSTTFSCPTDTCWWRHAAVTGKRGSGKLSTIFHYFPLFATILSTIFLSALLKGGAVCGARHAALGEPLYLIPKLRSDICQTCATSVYCVQRHKLLRCCSEK